MKLVFVGALTRCVRRRIRLVELAVHWQCDLRFIIMRLQQEIRQCLLLLSLSRRWLELLVIRQLICIVVVLIVKIWLAHLVIHDRNLILLAIFGSRRRVIYPEVVVLATNINVLWQVRAARLLPLLLASFVFRAVSRLRLRDFLNSFRLVIAGIDFYIPDNILFCHCGRVGLHAADHPLNSRQRKLIINHWLRLDRVRILQSLLSFLNLLTRFCFFQQFLWKKCLLVLEIQLLRRQSVTVWQCLVR